MIVRDAGRPPLDGGSDDLDGAVALPAHEVVVVLGGWAGAVPGFAVVAAQEVDGPALDERLQVPVDGGEPDRLAAVVQLVVQLERALEPVGACERVGDGGPLPGAALRDGHNASVPLQLPAARSDGPKAS